MNSGGARLRRSLRLTQLFTLGFGLVVGIGWMLLVGDWIMKAGPVGAVSAFVAGALLIGVIGLCYAEIASAYPEAGGEVVYAHRVFGPDAAFAVGWMLTLIYVAVSAFEAIGFAWLATIIFPPIEGPLFYRVLGEDVHGGSLAIGLIGMAMFGWINYRGAALAARVQDILIYAKLAISAGFVAAAILRGDPDNLVPYFASPPSQPLDGFLAVFITAPFWYAGFGVIAQALGERAEGTSLRLAGLSILIVIAASCIFYTLVILAVAMISPRADLADAFLPAAAAFEMAFNSRGVRDVIIAAGMLGLLTAWNGLFFSSGRVLLALGREKLLPRSFAQLSTHGTPGFALALITLAGALGVFAGKGVINPIVNLSGLIFACIFLVVCLAVVARRRKGEPPAPFQVPGGTFTAACAALVALFIIIIAVWEIARSSAAPVAPEFVALGLWGAPGFLMYLAARRPLPTKGII